MRALASHQCGLGSIPAPSVICGLSCCWFSPYSERCFSRYMYSSFRLSSKTNIPKFQFDLESECHRFVSRKTDTCRCYPRQTKVDYDRRYPFIHLGEERQYGIRFVQGNNTMAETRLKLATSRSEVLLRYGSGSPPMYADLKSWH